MPNNLFMGQFALLVLTALLFTVAFFFGLRHMRRLALKDTHNDPANFPRDTASMVPASRASVALATVLILVLLAWRAFNEGKLSLALSNHFDAFLVLALLLDIMLLYFRWTRNLRSLSFFLLPMIVILLLLGAILSIVSPQTYEYGSIWMRVHILTVVTGTACFALGCVGGVVYLLSSRQLKHKGLDPTHRWNGLPPLASIEKFNQLMIYLGFPLLTIAMLTGILRLAQEPEVPHTALLISQISLTALAWIVYGVLAHLPLTPRFRGTRAAWLWIIGFALFIGGYIAANWARQA